MRSSEKWGVDVDTAVDLALKELKSGCHTCRTAGEFSSDTS